MIRKLWKPSLIVPAAFAIACGSSSSNDERSTGGDGDGQETGDGDGDGDGDSGDGDGDAATGGNSGDGDGDGDGDTGGTAMGGMAMGTGGSDPVGPPPCPTNADGFAGGNGGLRAPYQICSRDQLEAIADDPSLNYVLIRDLDLSESQWMPLSELTGSFDGDGHEITGLTLVGADAAFIDSLSGTVENVSFSEVDGTNLSSTGAVVGETVQDSNAALNNVHVKGVLSGSTHIAGVAGSIRSGTSATYLTFEGDVTGSGDFVGGVLDSCAGTCSRLVLVGGNVSGVTKVGGIVQQLNGTLEQSASHGSISGSVGQVGGLVGVMGGGELRDSYSWASVQGATEPAGSLASFGRTKPLSNGSTQRGQ